MKRLAALLVGLGACTGSATNSTEPTDTAPPATDAVDAPQSEPGSDGEPEERVERCEPAIERVRLVRQRSVPGGRQLHLALALGDGTAVDAVRAAQCLTIADERLGELAASFGPAAAGPGATLIVARRSDGDADASRTVIDDVVASRPDDEVIAVWSWADDLVQVVGPTTDRDRIARRLDATWTASSADALPAADVAVEAAEEWERLADDALLGLRSIVFVAPSLELAEPPDLDRDVVIDHWITSTGSVDAPPAATSSGGLVVVGFCDDGGELDLSIADGDVVERSFGIGDAAVEHKGRPCTPDEARDATPPERLVLDATFRPDELEVYERALRQLDERSSLPIGDRVDATDDVEWTATMIFGDPPESAPYTAKFRGRSTLGCERRSRTIDFDGGDARHLLAASGTDEFTLVSLCADPGYVRQLVGQQVMRMFDLWHLETSTVEFRIEGRSQGVYLLGERLVDEVRNDRTRVSSVIRRDYDIAGRPAEVDHVAEGTEAEARARYDELVAVAEELSGEELVEALRTRLDLDQYLRWIAVNTALGNGDYVDEVYFIGEETLGADGEPAEYFTIHAWDPDGIFTPCHREGRLAIEDPDGLLYCTEALLDRALFDDPVVEELYAETLASVLDRFGPEELAAIADEAAATVTRWLDDDEVAAAMNEFADAFPDDGGVRDFVELVAADLVARYEAQRSELIDRLDAFRAR